MVIFDILLLFVTILDIGWQLPVLFFWRETVDIPDALAYPIFYDPNEWRGIIGSRGID